jgi:hypothetical protein
LLAKATVADRLPKLLRLPMSGMLVEDATDFIPCFQQLTIFQEPTGKSQSPAEVARLFFQGVP